MKWNSVDQVAIAVSDLQEVKETLKNVWGFRLSDEEKIEEQGVNTVFVKIGQTHLEFMEPLSKESPVGRFLEKKGRGIQHIALSVDNLEFALAELKSKNVELINEQPKIGAGGHKIAFVHPKSFFGILLELIEKP